MFAGICEGAVCEKKNNNKQTKKTTTKLRE
jgi:hypothetical protein